jgi:GNAT superfamily N-acetyltransferase
MLVLSPDVSISEFTNMLCRREQLILEDIADRVRTAHTLCAHYADTDPHILTGIAALKRPSWSYRQHLRDMAGLSEDLPNIEVGWFYVEPDRRERGVGALMMLALMHELKPSIIDEAHRPDAPVVEQEIVRVFATTALHNVPMERILERHGFRPIGSPYWSSQGSYQLRVWST